MGYKLNECKIAVRVHNRQDGGFDVQIRIIDVTTGEVVHKYAKQYTNLTLPILRDYVKQKAFDLARDCGYDHVKVFDANFKNLEGELIYE